MIWGTLSRRVFPVMVLGVVILLAPGFASAQNAKKAIDDAAEQAVQAAPLGLPDLYDLMRYGRKAKAAQMRARAALRRAEAIMRKTEAGDDKAARGIAGKAVRIARLALRRATVDLKRLLGIRAAFDLLIGRVGDEIAGAADDGFRHTPGFVRGHPRETEIRAIVDTLRQLWPGGMRETMTVRILNIPYIEQYARASKSFIYIDKGYLDTKPGKDELYFVLGHEMAHAKLGHVAHRIVRNEFNVHVANLEDKAKAFVKGRGPSLSERARQRGVRRLVEKNYDRVQETKADIVGVELALSAGAAPKGLRAILDRMKKGEPKFATPAARAKASARRSHPFTDERERMLRRVFGARLNGL